MRGMARHAPTDKVTNRRLVAYGMVAVRDHNLISTVLLILLLASAVRFHALMQDFRFHPDEAFFSTFARNAAVHGEWMLPGPLDKTPLSIYTSALSIHFTAATLTDQNLIEVDTRTGEFAARLPNTFGTIMLVAVGYAIARTLSHPIAGAWRPVSLCTAVLIALSPYLIAYSASAFTDTFMVLFGMLAMWMAARQHPAWSGMWLVLSIASKQQGVFFLPLIIGVIWLTSRAYSSAPLRMLRFSIPFVAGMALLLMWDAARPETSVFTLASVNNNPERFFTRPDEWLPRMKTWLGYAQWALGPGWLTALLAGVSLVYTVRFRHRIDLLLWAYIAAYGLAHTLIAFNTYDRYVLPLVPLLAILAGRGVFGRWHVASRRMGSDNRRGDLTGGPYIAIAVIICFGILLHTAYRTASGAITIGRDTFPRQNTITELAQYLNAKPLGAIIYDHYLGWELGYYMGAWSDKRRVYYPTPEIQAEDAVHNPDLAPRYLVSPQNKPIEPWLDAMAQAGFTISEDYQTGDYTVFELIPPRRTEGDADAESS